MALVEALVLGIVWGLTVVWPVSAQAHGIVLPWAADTSPLAPAVSAGLLLGTILATVVAGHRDAAAGVRALPHALMSMSRRGESPMLVPRRQETPEDRSLRGIVLIAIAAIPGALVGIFAENTIGPWLRGEEGPRSLALWAGIALIAGAGFLIYADRSGDEHRRLRHLSWRDAIVLGLAQATAILPGISRMAAVLIAARFQGLAREDAVRLGLWSGLPLYVGALVAALRRVPEGTWGDHLDEMLIAGVASFLMGVMAIALLRAIARKARFTVFAGYRVVVGVMFIIFAVVAG